MPTTPDPIEPLRQLEEAVRSSDDEGITARWKSGRCLSDLRVDGKLPRGLGSRLAKELGVHRSELTARMKLATKAPTEEALANLISKFRTWFEIKQRALTDTPREGKARSDRNRLQRVADLLDNIDPTDLGGRDFALLERIARAAGRLQEGAASLQVKAA